MSTWTTSALQALEGYLERNRLQVAACGADTDEVMSDLRRHVEEEVASLNLSVVTEDDVQRIVTRIGPLPGEEEEERNWKTSSPSSEGRAKVPSVAAVVPPIFGVMLPVLTLAFELFTHLCAGTFFDPLPTWFHVLVVAIVPAANSFAWLTLRTAQHPVPRWLWLANGVALGATGFYGALFLPMSPFAVLGVLWFGFGLLPLAPLLAFIATLKLRARLRQRIHERKGCDPRGWGWAAATSFSLLLVSALPGPLTRYWVDQAGSDSPAESTRAIQWLRSWGREETILMECYGLGDRLWVEIFGGRRANVELARAVYYRVTGKPFNSVPPPLSKYQRAGRALFDEFDWDPALGTDAVAGQVKGLSVAQSRMDGFCQADEGCAYLEWTLEFRNDHPKSPREARAQLQLPPGGVVSRLTLWVNGEEREAAFAGRAQVRDAYQNVAVQQRRDPVLVTTCGPDHVLVQCFPVPSNGGTMKVRLGVTAPLVVENASSAALRLPCFLERNFALPRSLEHSLWLEASQLPSAHWQNVSVDLSKRERYGLRGRLADTNLSSDDGTLHFRITPKLREVRAKDHANEPGLTIKQTLETDVARPPQRIAMVLDGSEDMTRFFSQIARALDRAPSGSELAMWFAQDGAQQILHTTGRSREPVSETVGKLLGVGGQDDLPALLQAWEWAAAKPDSVVLWIHGPQPVLVNDIEALKQRLEWRSADGPRIMDLSTGPGPNRIAEQLAAVDALIALPRLGQIKDDLERTFAIWSGRQSQFRWVRVVDQEGHSVEGALPATASLHVVRLWAFDQVRSLIKSRRTAEAIKLAARYQLVTPVSGAVVLETEQQFKNAGLTPVDPATAPVVPEPSPAMLIFAGMALLALWRKRRLVFSRAFYGFSN